MFNNELTHRREHRDRKVPYYSIVQKITVIFSPQHWQKYTYKNIDNMRTKTKGMNNVMRITGSENNVKY